MNDYVPRLTEWFELKRKLSSSRNAISFKEREIWWCSVGMNLGEEIYGKGKLFNRPVLIFKKFTSNSFMALPLTSKEKKGSWYVKILHASGESCVILNQARILDKKRLTNRIDVVDGSEFRRIRESFLKLYGS